MAENKQIVVALLVEELKRKLGRQPTQAELEARAWQLVNHVNERNTQWKKKKQSGLH
jgi:hypothetical protein